MKKIRVQIKMPSTTSELYTFFESLVKAGVNFNPEDDYRNYAFYDTGRPCFTSADAGRLNEVIKNIWDVFDEDDVYQASMDAMSNRGVLTCGDSLVNQVWEESKDLTQKQLLQKISGQRN